MSTVDTQRVYYRPGLLFLSKYAALQIPVLDAKFYIDPNTQIREQIRPPVMAMFSDESMLGGESPDEDGFIRADIRGGAFDLDLAAEHYGWDEVEREAVAKKLLRICEDPGQTDFYLYEEPEIEPPWPTYAAMSEARIPQVAAEMGLLGEALAFELRVENREKVVTALQKKIDDRSEEGDIEEA